MGFPLKQAPLYTNDYVAELEKFNSVAAGVQVDYCGDPGDTFMAVRLIH
jgi:hypothetical protein